MTWANFYLVCFLVGFILSVLAALSGNLHLHLPHFDLHHGIPHLHVGHAHGGHSGLSPINFGTIAAFLAWFGGTGYLLTEYSPLVFLTALLLSVVAGLGGAALVFWFLAKLVHYEHPLDPGDYRMIGVLGRVSSRIRAGGTGEMIYSREGTRRCAVARSEDGTEIPRDTEVVITRYEKGIAYVERWEDLSGEVSPDKEKNAQA